MLKSQATTNKRMGSISSLETYHILLQRQINEDRIVVERTSMFLLASSFLFLAFVTLLNPTLAPIFKVLRIALPIFGILLTLLLYCLNRAAINALAFWHVGQRKIEEEAPEFDYMQKNELTPHIHGYECTLGQKEWKRNKDDKWVLERIGKLRGWLRKPLLGTGTGTIYKVYFPLMFLALWVVSLIVAITN